MTGAPRTAYAGGEFIAVRRAAVEALGSWEAAGVWHRVCWRAERTGGWVATIAEIAEDCYLSVERTKTALQKCRDAGWLTTERASGRDRTLRWTPIWGEETKRGNPPHLDRESPSTSFETEKTSTPPSRPPSPDEALFAGPETAAPPLRDVNDPDPIAEEFAEFWSTYPNHSSGRKPALAKYRAARKTTSREVIMAGLAAHLPVYLAKAESGDKGFIPYATTWLNQERWEADPPPMPRTPKCGNPFANPDLLTRPRTGSDVWGAR